VAIEERIRRLEANRRPPTRPYETPPGVLLFLKRMDNARRQMDGLEPVPLTAEEEALEAEHYRELLASNCYGLRDDPGWKTDEARAVLDHFERTARENLKRHRKEER
jgi:hypothetical protein